MGFLSNIFQKSPQAQLEYNSAIALDIGTEFVKSLIFKVEGREGVVLGVGRQRQRLSDMQGGAVTDISGVIENAEKSLEQAAAQAGFLPEQVIMGIAGELVKGTTTTIRYLREKPVAKITYEELKEIIAKVQRRAFERARSVLAFETGLSEIEVRLVNAAVVDVRIDGYKVTNPLGFQGKEVVVGVFNAFAPIVHLGALQTIASSLELDLLAIAAEPYAVARAVSEEKATDFSVITMDIGGGTTDVAVVSQGGVAGTKMFALGGRAFTKRLAQVFGVSFEEAEELKLKYSRGELAELRQKKVAEVLAVDCDVWFSGVELTLEELQTTSKLELLPSRILLCGGGSSLPEIAGVLRQKSFSRKLPFAKKPVVQFIQPADVAKIHDQTEKLTEPADITPLCLANLSLDLVGKPSLMDSLLKSIVQSLKS